MRRLRTTGLLRGGGRRAVLRRHAAWPATAFAATSRALQEIGELLGCRVIPLELVEPRYYHLDTCFCPLAADTGDLLSAGLRRVRPQGVGGRDSATDCRERGRGLAFRLQRRGAGADGDYQHRLPGAMHRRLSAEGFTPCGDAARRIRPRRRQREMSYAAAGRRRCRRLAQTRPVDKAPGGRYHSASCRL